MGFCVHIEGVFAKDSGLLLEDNPYIGNPRRRLAMREWARGWWESDEIMAEWDTEREEN
jgi:hypothetical protein